MSIGPILVAPLFFSILIGLTRPKGKRWAAGIVSYATYIMLFAVLWGVLTIANTMIVSLLYGPWAALSGRIRVVGDRHSVVLSNGERYGGIWEVLWFVVTFLTMMGVGYCSIRTGRWLCGRSATTRRIVFRYMTIMSSLRQPVKPEAHGKD